MHQPPPTAPVLLISNQIGPLRDAVHFSPLSRAFFPNHAFRFCLPVFSLLSVCLCFSIVYRSRVGNECLVDLVL